MTLSPSFQVFRTETTLDVVFRKQQLKALFQALEAHEQDLADALWTDLHKSYEEAYLTELSLVKAEIRCGNETIVQANMKIALMDMDSQD